KQRIDQIRLKAKEFAKCLQVGGTFLGLSFSKNIFDQFIETFLISLGIRRVNKLWTEVSS
ncbi:MAG: hypothetical protein ABIQ95_13185, partial [Bdellovibrionia bacterium]